jgi:Fe-Mn family superoxide dismutase
MSYELPSLRFGYQELEPYFSEAMLRHHHLDIQRAYTDKINRILRVHPALDGQTIERLMRSLPSLPDDVREQVRLQGGGHANHQFLWKIIGPPGKTAPSGPLAQDIERTFGSFARFKDRFIAAATALPGNGWAFLAVDRWGPGQLEILTLPGNDSVLPLGKPGVLICDLWDHAREPIYASRPDYLDAFFKVIDWTACETRFIGFRDGSMKI